MSKDPGYSDSKRDALESKVRQYQSTILELQEQVLVLGKLQAENENLKECVEFYAESKKYQGYSSNRTGEYEYYHGSIIDDSGKRARQVLKELDENK